jgi:DNA invertase Pin-like site-specific DNA recombinase
MNNQIENSVSTSRTIALCYVRKSSNQDVSVRFDPEYQRANIQAVCEARNWTPIWFEDIENHQSALEENTRPGWLELKSHLGDVNVVALVANDLSRMHEKSWRTSDLIDFVKQHNIELVLADLKRHQDLSSAMGIFFAQLSAIFDEWYTRDTLLYKKGEE